MKLSEMRALLAARGIQLTKSLGQNFLHDGNQLRRIVTAAELTRADKVLEIGPGLGPLTELLLAQAGEVLAIEKDARLVEVLAARLGVTPIPTATGLAPAQAGETQGQGPGGRLRLLHADALAFLRREPHDWRGWKLVANLPYSAASPILVELAQSPHRPERLVVTLQLEVARRLMARAGQPDYGALTLLVQLDYEPRQWFKIPASCFFPEPDVDSACVVLVRRAHPLLPGTHRAAFAPLVKRAFGQRRKTMAKLLRADWPAEQLAAAWQALALPPAVRAEQVTLEQFAALTRQLHEETFDIVNERDEVVGRAPRGEVHARGLRHRAVHVLVFNARGEVFLQKRSLRKDRQPGVWDSSASGHVNSGEDYDACAVREVHEELGVTLAAPPVRLFKLNACAATDQEFVWVYRARHDGPFRLSPEEIERGDWFAPAAVTRWLAERPEEFATALRVIWPRWLAQH